MGKIRIAVLVFVGLLATGCSVGMVASGIGTAAMMGSAATTESPGTYQDKMAINFDAPQADAIGAVMKAGKDLGYDVKRQGKYTAMLSSGMSTGDIMKASALSTLTFGLAQSSKPTIMITAQAAEDGSRVDMGLIMAGKLKNDTVADEATKILNDLKKKIVEVKVSSNP